jgi:hypothetical protein
VLSWLQEHWEKEMPDLQLEWDVPFRWVLAIQWFSVLMGAVFSDLVGGGTASHLRLWRCWKQGRTVHLYWCTTVALTCRQQFQVS